MDKIRCLDNFQNSWNQTVETTIDLPLINLIIFPLPLHLNMPFLLAHAP